MSEQRGPDFLPYPLPERAAAPVGYSAPVPPVPARGRWAQALDALPPAGILSVGTGLAALALLVLITLAADQHGAGAVVTTLAAGVSLVSGWVAVKPAVPKDSRMLVVAAQSLGVVSALTAVIVYAAGGEEGPEPVSVPSPQPSSSASAAPSQPAPTTQPSPLTSIPPGAVNGFGVPSMPGAPLTQDPSDLGTLYGHVVDTSGTPVQGATVVVERAKAGDVSETPDCPTRVTTQTDAEGVYRLQLCQLGEGLGYRVTISVGTAKASASLFVNSGETTVYDVILPR